MRPAVLVLATLLASCSADKSSDAGAFADAVVADASAFADAVVADSSAFADAAVDSGVDSGVADAGAPDAAVCGQPGRYDGCNARLGMADCLAQAGRWGRWGLSPSDSCLCPTGDDGCPCTDGDQCDGSCIAPLPQGNDCSTVPIGACAPTRPTFGCHCFFTAGRGAGLCVD